MAQLADLPFTVEEFREICQLLYQAASDQALPASAPDEPHAYLQYEPEPTASSAEGFDAGFADM